MGDPRLIADGREAPGQADPPVIGPILHPNGVFHD